MPSNLNERFEQDVRNIREGDPINALPDVLLGWLRDSAFLETLRDIPSAERRAALAKLGVEAFERDLGEYASGLRGVASGLDYVWTPEAREEIFRRHCALLFANLSDIIDFLEPDAAQDVLKEVEYVGLEHLRDAQQDGVGVFVLSIHQSHPSFAFRHPTVNDVPVSAVAHEPGHGTQEQSKLLDGLRSRVELLPVSPAAIRPMLARLRSNGCVAIYADFLYDATPPITSALFGRILPIASGAVHLAVRNKTPVLPVSVARLWPPDSGGVEVKVFPPIRLPEVPEGQSPAELLAIVFGITMEGMIRRRPENWRLWPTLLHRWQS